MEKEEEEGRRGDEERSETQLRRVIGVAGV